VRAFIRVTVLATGLAAAAKGTQHASAGEASRTPEAGPAPRELRNIADHYRGLTTTYERAARQTLTRSIASYRHSTSRRYLQWTIDLWQSRAEQARAQALVVVQKRAHVKLPEAPAVRAPIDRRIVYHRELAWALQKVYPRHTTRGSESFRTTQSAGYRRWVLRLWQRRAADAALAVSTHVQPRPANDPLTAAFMCIHRYEGPWNSNTGNGYYGGLQMDWSFMRLHGADFLARWGTADHWPVWAQIEAAARAHRSGREFSPWPNTARYCALA
jgi:hypothetical protein